MRIVSLIKYSEINSIQIIFESVLSSSAIDKLNKTKNNNKITKKN